MKEKIMTSEEWCKIDKHKDTVVLDPDGWDRKNFHYSWHEEQISEKEFMRRRSHSTCMFGGKK